MLFSDDTRRLDTICRHIANGRRLVRQLAAALREHPLSEAEFRLLWLIREEVEANSAHPVEQKVLAERSGISPAQVSAVVEGLRCRQIIASDTDAKDRRKQYWRLTTTGRECLQSVVSAVGVISRDWTLLESAVVDSCSQLEDAA